MKTHWKMTLTALAVAMAAAAPAAAQDKADVAAAEKEGKVVWYASVDVKVAEAIAEDFRKAHPKIDVEVERSGSERVYQRVNQEHQSGIKHADVVNTSDSTHFITWKKKGMLAKYVPAGVDKIDKDYRDPEGYYATWRATLCVMGYNTNIVPPNQVPKGYKDLLDPKWKGKLTKAHPSYSGTSLTGTYAITKVLGWDYLEKLSKQNVQQLQSTTATPKSIASGERAVMVDGNEYNMFIEINKKSPVKVIYPVEGTPFVSSPVAVFSDAPHPHAARLFADFLFSQKVQQYLVDKGGLRSVVPGVKDPEGRTPLSQIKVIPDDPEGMLPHVEEIKKKYAALFGGGK
ncbi:MAG TPA: extracellular solute-binding protein [Usitatibacter sp.]|jgi:iron(III) transport system substrate-binding protein|nr:extracellular solute-binding protein [Usitatibacter sp.]